MISIKTEGSPYERGLIQGRSVAEIAAGWIDNKLTNLDNRFGLKNVREKTNNYVQMYKTMYYDGFEEYRGIGEGMGIKIDDYFAAVFSWIFLAEFENCTTMGFTDENGRALIGKTDDIHKNELGSNLMEITIPDKGYKHVHFHFAGSIWSTAGMNEHGLCMGMTGIPGACMPKGGLASLDGLHTILPNVRNTAELLDHIKALNIGYYGFSLLAADHEENIILIEKTGKGTKVVKKNDHGAYIHTNHILDKELADMNPPQKEEIYTNGLKRYNNAFGSSGSINKNIEGMKGFLTEKTLPGAIFQTGQEGLYTDYAVVFQPSARKIIFLDEKNQKWEELVIS